MKKTSRPAFGIGAALGLAAALVAGQAWATPAFPLRAPLSERGLIFPDISRWNHVADWNALDRASHGIVAMKVRQSDTDPLFHPDLKQAERRGMIVLGYAFGYGGSGAAQADALLRNFPLRPGRVLVLDLERNPTGSSMSTGEAEAFVSEIRRRTGRYPMVYASDSRPRPGALARCPRWSADWSDRPSAGALIWQFTNGRIGPGGHTIPGIGHVDLDRLLIPYGELRRLAGVDDRSSDAPGARPEDGPSFRKDHPWRTEVLRRVDRQSSEIAKAARSGRLTRRQAAELEALESDLRRKEQGLARQNGGTLTAAEHRALNARLDDLWRKLKAEERQTLG